MMTEVERQALGRLVEALNRFDGVKVSGQDYFNDRIYISFDYKPRQASVIEKVEFIDWLARILGSSDDYAAYVADIGMCWMGFKGVDIDGDNNPMNEPFFELETFPSDIESLTDVLRTAVDIGVAMPHTVIANHYPAEGTIPRGVRISIDKKVFTLYPYKCFAVPSFFVYWVATFARAIRAFKDFVSNPFTRHYPFPFHRHKSNTMNKSC
jgi:hypothetical protein